MLKFKCGKFSLPGLIRKLKEGVMAALKVQIPLLYTCVSEFRQFKSAFVFAVDSTSYS